MTTSGRSGTQRAKPYEKKIVVPAADVSVREWLVLQENASASLRHVIRAYIERHGMTDPLCEPVVQRPRRGRPPRDAYSYDETDDMDESYEIDDVADEAPAARPRQAEPTKAAETNSTLGDTKVDDTATALEPMIETTDESDEIDDINALLRGIR